MICVRSAVLALAVFALFSSAIMLNQLRAGSADRITGLPAVLATLGSDLSTALPSILEKLDTFLSGLIPLIASELTSIDGLALVPDVLLTLGL